MVFYGPGRWSIDAVIFKGKAVVPATTCVASSSSLGKK